MDFLVDSGILDKAWKVLIIVAILWVVKRFGMIIIERAVRGAITADTYASKDDEKAREDTIISIVRAIVRVGIWVFGSMLILAQLGVNIGPLIAGASIAGVAIGFGAQSIVKDFVSGLFMIMENQYRVGDVVTVAGITGTVESITVRQTILRDVEGQKHHVPNGSIDIATNLTMEYANVHLKLGVSYDSEIEKVEEVINEVGTKMSNDPKWRNHIQEAPSFVRVDNFGASEVEVKVLGRVEAGQQWAVAGEFRRRIKQAFDKHGIEIPYPQLVTHKAKAGK